MDNQIFQIVEGIIVSFGGAAAIIGAIVKLCADTIAERLSRKYEIKLNKELESYKAQLDKKTYISRARFDAEFQIYKDLSEKVLSMAECTYWLFPRGLDQVPMDEEERKKIYLERYKTAGEAIGQAQSSIRANAPFIPKAFYEQFEEIAMLCLQQRNMYAWCGELAQVSKNSMHQSETMLKEEEKCWTRTEEIWKKRELLMQSLREYLQKLDVSEG